MQLSRCTPWLLSFAGVLAACSDDPAPTPAGQDASVAGADASAQGHPDAAMQGNPDAAPLGPCDPLTGGNCPTDQVCYYDQGLDRNACRIPFGMPLGGNEQACQLGTMDCQAGFSCFSAQGLPNNVCLKACATNADCNGLMGSGTNGYFCATFGAPSMPKFCLPRPNTCDVYMQMCAMNGNCTIINNDGDLGCVASGTVAIGGGCARGPCAKGGHCLDVGMGGPKCYAPCSTPLHPCPMGTGRCATVMPPLPWGGICVP